MTYTHRARPTAMYVCDICDGEIERDADGSSGRANLMVGISPMVQVTDKTRHALLCWGRRRINAQDDPRPTASYDFHGGCIANLIDSARIARTEGDPA